MQTRKFIRLSCLRFLRPCSGEWTRKLARAGRFGPLYRPRNSERGLLLGLSHVLARLGLSEPDLAPALSAYEKAHRTNRPAIVTLAENEVKRITD